MNRLLRMLLSVSLAVPLAVSGVLGHEGKHGAQTLATGRYTAKVKALVCGACAKKIMETARTFPGIENMSVDQKTSTLNFAVAPDAHIDVAKLQAALKAASDEMGMGADYSLSDIRKAAKKKAKKKTE